MANEQVLAKAIIDIGTSGIPDAEAHLRSLEADLRTVGRRYSEGTIEIGEYAKQHSRLNTEIEKYSAGIATAKAMTAEQTAAVKPLTEEVRDLADAYGLVKAVTAEQEAKAKALAREQRDLARTYELVDNSAKGATATQTVYATASDKSAASARRLADSQEQVSAQGGNLAKSGKNTGMAFLELSRAFEDAQFGLRGVLNNIPTTIQMFGGSAGLAAGVSVAAVSFSILEPYITQFIADMGVFGEKTFKATDEIGRLNERISELQNKPIKLEVDLIELDEAKKKIEELQKAQAAFKAAGEGRTVFEAEAGKQFQEGFEQSGQAGKAARDAMVAAEAKARGADSPEIKKAIDRAASIQKDLEFLKSMETHSVDEQAMVNAQIQDRLQALQAAQSQGVNAKRFIEDQARNTIGGLFERAGKGNDANARADLARRFRGVGAEGLARQTEFSTPELMEQQSDEETAFDKSVEGMRALRKKQAKAESERLKKANEAAAASERDPNIQADLKRNREKFGGLGREGVTLDNAIENVRALEKGREKPQELPEIPPASVRQKNERAFAEEGLARQIFAGSQQATGVQFSPDQARAAAKATGDLVGRNVNFNVALQSALAEQVQAMSAMGNQLMSQASQMQQIRMEFQMVRRGLQTRQRTAGKRGG